MTLIMLLKLNEFVIAQKDKEAKILQLEKVLRQLQVLQKSMTAKQDLYQNNQNRIKCPEFLDITRFKKFNRCCYK